MFGRFVQLGQAPDSAVKDFAERWGVLRLCKHLLPATHHHACRFLEEQAGKWRWEPVTAWRHYARQAASLLSIASRLHDNRPGDHDDWRTVYEWANTGGFSYSPVVDDRWLTARAGLNMEDAGVKVSESDGPIPWWPSSVAQERIRLAAVVNHWLKVGAVRPLFSWAAGGGARPKIAFGGGLFGALAIRLMLAVGHSALATCSGCEHAYLPEKRPGRVGRHYCDACRAAKVPERDAARAYRARQSNKQGDDDGR